MEEKNQTKKILTKTFMETTTEKIDKESNEFRQKHKCIATDAYATILAGQIFLIQTIYYQEGT